MSEPTSEPRSSATPTNATSGHATSATVEPAAPLGEQPASEPSFTVLVVDDNEVIRETCGRFLEQRGYQVLVTDDGTQALALLEKVRVDLILLDVMMPGLSGFEVLSAVRERWSPQELPVIMATAKDQSRDVIEAFSRGANDYVTKPLDFPVLQVRLKAQLRARLAAHEEEAPLHAELTIAAGTVLDGKYRLESLIGRGSFGVVYRARHLTLARPVAVKLLDARLGDRDTSIARFRREGVAACRVDHPNAVSVLDSSVTALGVPFLVMELLEGHDLEAELKLRGRLAPERCAEILLPVCDVLSEAHAVGMIHRDIKPQNIFLHRSRQGETVKVLDFGIAKLVDSAAGDSDTTPEEGVVGTPIYMAPERFLDEPYDVRSDVYSLGVMLYEMLAGELPFGTAPANPLKVIFKHLNDEPRPLLGLCPELPGTVGELVHQALAKHPSARPTARELGERFAAAVGAVPLGAPAAGAGSDGAGGRER